jgi:hypothetical protein
MQLRKVKASALVTNDLNVAAAFVEEQATAQGNFPGPCPVIYSGQDIEAAIQLGVSAVIIDTSNNADVTGIDTILKVQSPEDVAMASTNAFLVDGDSSTIKDVLAAIPSDALVMASLNAMQNENAELQKGNDLKQLGATSILLKNACVGDAEDVQYSSFAIDGLTKKKSSTFNMSGLTGSTNGHYGGIASTQATTWLRMKQ